MFAPPAPRLDRVKISLKDETISADIYICFNFSKSLTNGPFV